MPTGRDNRFGVVWGKLGEAVVVALCHCSAWTVFVDCAYLAVVKFVNGVLGDRVHLIAVDVQIPSGYQLNIVDFKARRNQNSST